MKVKLIILFLACIELPVATNAWSQINVKSIYRGDQRQEISEVKNPAIQQLAKSTVAIFNINDLKLKSGQYWINTTSMQNDPGLCSDQKYANQPGAADCSAVLVGEDLVFTAGHCISYKDCADSVFIFGYANDQNGIIPKSYAANEVYFCKEITSRSNTASLDFAIVKLDRAVFNHAPVKLATDRVAPNQNIFILGHPGGAPLKYSPPASVLSSTKNHFTADVDAIEGSSGAGVFLETTNELVGILVSGATDYVKDKDRGCLILKSCQEGECSGEDSTHINIFRENLKE